MGARKGDPTGKGAAMRAKIAAAQGLPNPDLIWIDPTLNNEQKQVLKEQDLDVEELAQIMAEFVDEGCRISVHWDERDDCYVCRIWPAQGDEERRGMVLVGRGSTGPKAIRQAYFKQEVILAGNWRNGVKTRAAEVIDD